MSFALLACRPVLVPPARRHWRLFPCAAQAAGAGQACTGPPSGSTSPCGAPASASPPGQPLTIVAIGSSSTSGAGASSSAASYPARLEVELKERFPARTIRVLNRGVGGEEAADMLARFDQAVLAEQPDLVLWQVGTNSVLRGHSLAIAAVARIHEGLERLKAQGVDVVLIDPQFAPKVIDQAGCREHGGVLLERAAKARERRASSTALPDAPLAQDAAASRSRRSCRPTACT